MYLDWLREEGVTAQGAANGEEAIEKWTSDIDVVFLDRRMPELSGDKVLSRKRKEGDETPVAVLTAVDIELSDTEMDFDDYISKPVSSDDIIQVAKELLIMDNMRTEVREFINAAMKLQKLDQRHTQEELSTHDQYNSLRSKCDRLLRELSNNKGDLTESEKEALAQTKEKLTV
jgi:CheY-like chemotaxis protein